MDKNISAFAAEFIILQDWSEQNISSKTRDIFIDLIENERYNFQKKLQKPNPTMQDVLKALYDEANNRVRLRYGMLSVFPDEKTLHNIQNETFCEYLKCISNTDLIKQNKTVYLTDYADGIDENFGKVVFRAYWHNVDRYNKMPGNLKQYISTYCTDAKKNFEEKHNISSGNLTNQTIEEKIDPEVLSSSKVLQAVMDYKEKNPGKLENEKPGYITDDGNYML